MVPRPPRPNRTDTLFPYTTLFRSKTDDDVYVRLSEIVKDLEVLGSRVKLFWSGFVWRDAKPDLRSGNEYKNAENNYEMDILPPYCSGHFRSEEHTSELQTLMSNSYAVFCLKKTQNPNSLRTK